MLISRTSVDSYSVPAAVQWCRGAVPPRVILGINRNLGLDFTFIETAQPGAAGGSTVICHQCRGYKVDAMIIRNVICKRSNIPGDQGKEATSEHSPSP